MANALYNADDKTQAVEGMLPGSYKGSFQTALSVYDQAVDLKKQKDELQISMFEKAIDPVWQNYDKDNKGYITQDQFGELAKYALEQAGHGDKYNKEIFLQLLKQYQGEDPENPDGHLKKRDVASLLNTVVFGGL